MPIPVRIDPFLDPGCPGPIYAGLARVSPGCPPDRGRLHTCYSPVRRSPAATAETVAPLPLDLHVLSLPLAFILSQDQTLRCCLSFSRFFTFSLCLSRLPLYLLSRIDGKLVPFPCLLLPESSLDLTEPRLWTAPITGPGKLLSCGFISLFSLSTKNPGRCPSGCL